jgi:membrane associated rhomboid family serine protease
MSYTLIILIITVLVSIVAFRNEELFNKLILWPKRMYQSKEYYRLLTSGFIHADQIHLIFNMIALFFFGPIVEQYFKGVGIPVFLFPVLYLVGIIAASIPSLLKHKNDGYYRSLGASGGVAAVLFAFIYFDPWQIITIWFIPVPGIIAAVAYLIYSAYMSRHGKTNVNHDAHFWGAVFGFIFTLLLAPDHGENFLHELLHPRLF